MEEDKVMTISSCDHIAIFNNDRYMTEDASKGKYAIVGAIIMIFSVLLVSLLTPVNMLILFKDFIPFAVVSLLMWGSIALTQKLLSHA
ncbi:MAG: hypothetical protein VYA60_07835 [Pseudomonadota bacterium]|nr:hypothetical protein [Pseudomonadota bacterium]